MPLFILNILFASVFTLFTGSGHIGVFMFGCILGYGVLWLSSPLHKDTRYFKKLPKVLNLITYFLKELIVSNLRVLWDVITPGLISHPGIIGIDLDAETDLEIFLVANLVSLTPGTLSVDLSGDRKTLFVHVMFLENVADARADIKHGLEKRVLEVMRS